MNSENPRSSVLGAVLAPGPQARAGVVACLFWWLWAFLQATLHNQTGFAPMFWLGFFLPGAVLLCVAGGFFGWAAGKVLPGKAAVAVAFAVPFLVFGWVLRDRLTSYLGYREALLGSSTLSALLLTVVVLVAAQLAARRFRFWATHLAGVVLALLGSALLGSAPGVEKMSEAELEEPIAVADAEATPTVLLFAVDGLDWDVVDVLVERGEMPQLEALLDQGARADLETYQPTLSPLIWNTIATGRDWREHGVMGFAETHLPRSPQPLTLNGTMLEDLMSLLGRAAARISRRYPITSFRRMRRPFWDVFEQAGVDSVTTNWWGTHPAFPGSGMTASDLVFADRTQKAFAAQGEAAFSGGFAAEGEELERLQAAAAGVFSEQAEQEMDARLRAHLAGIGDQDDRALAPLYPHLRQSDRSARFLIEEMRRGEAQVYTWYTRIVDIAQHRYWQFWSPDDPAYARRPPDPAEVERLGEVIPVTHRIVDEQLGAMRSALGEGATVIIVSDHGFHAITPEHGSVKGMPISGHHWQAPPGVWFAHGPGIRSGDEYEAVTLFEVLPTLAAYLGVPVAENLEGEPRTEMFSGAHRQAFPVRHVPTYEIAEWRQKRAAAAQAVAFSEGEMDDLRQLGYAE